MAASTGHDVARITLSVSVTSRIAAAAVVTQNKMATSSDHDVARII